MPLCSIHQRRKDRPLLVLDIDETLLYAATSPLQRRCDYRAQRTWIYKRPHVDAFLHFCASRFEIAVWTGARRSYAEEIFGQVFSYINPAFIFCEQDCIATSSINNHCITVKPLSRLRQLGYSLERILVIDDRQENHCLNPANLICVKPYRAERHCNVLRLLQRYLESLVPLESIKEKIKLNAIDHRLWPQVAGAL